jgi:uncharacterized protein
MSVPARVGLATLGVSDVVRATEFYASLGWRLSPASVHGIISYFHTTGGIFALVDAGDLTMGSAAPRASHGPRSAMLAITAVSPAEVDTALRAAIQAGATLVQAGSPTRDGRYQGFFTDPDGHLWQITHHPTWPTGPDGLPHLP